MGIVDVQPVTPDACIHGVIPVGDAHAVGACAAHHGVFTFTPGVNGVPAGAGGYCAIAIPQCDGVIAIPGGHCDVAITRADRVVAIADSYGGIAAGGVYLVVAVTSGDGVVTAA